MSDEDLEKMEQAKEEWTYTLNARNSRGEDQGGFKAGWFAALDWERRMAAGVSSVGYKFEVSDLHVNDVKGVPHSKCPVCEGRGLVFAGFYEPVGHRRDHKLGAPPETCKSCIGKGVL